MVAKLKPGEVSEPLRTPTGFHIVKLNEVRGGGKQQAVEDQVHPRHILMKTNELADDATVQQKLNALRDRILQGRGLRRRSPRPIPRTRARLPRAGTLAGPARAAFVPEFEQVLETP